MRLAWRCLVVVLLVLFPASFANAISLSQYHQHVRQAVTALETLSQSDENESVTAFEARDGETVRGVRNLLPPNEEVEANGKTILVDNAWLHPELDRYLADKAAGRYELLRSITDRLKAIDDRITDLERPPAGQAESKEEAGRKLAEILSRPEYARKIKQESALTRLIRRFLKWLADLLPQPKPISPGSAGFISRIAQVVVIVLALGVLAFVLKMFLPRLFRDRRPRKKRDKKARIVLGERLEAEESAFDLLADAEALARRGELRAAIRRAYIALLVELGDRKIISLAQHKTNRDYLRALREVEPLHRNVKQLTESFERHWYGLSQADETDWQAFRSAYDQALR
jgi:uncharacterized protein DUF4129